MKTTNNKSLILTIVFTSSNVLYTLTGLTGKVLFWSSVGSRKIKGTKKITVTTIAAVTKLLLDRVIQFGYKYIHVKLKGFKKNKKTILRYLKTDHLRILSICDNTSLAHNGCKQPKRRRI